VRANEILAAMLLTAANISYYQQLMAGIRAAIARGQFEDFCAAAREGWARGDVA
jgi:queuine tRNA-ribosyltransferase